MSAHARVAVERSLLRPAPAGGISPQRKSSKLANTALALAAPALGLATLAAVGVASGASPPGLGSLPAVSRIEGSARQMPSLQPASSPAHRPRHIHRPAGARPGKAANRRPPSGTAAGGG